MNLIPKHNIKASESQNKLNFERKRCRSKQNRINL